MLPEGTAAPHLDGEDDQGHKVMLPALERWTLLVFAPVFVRYGCQECKTSYLHELYPEFRAHECYLYAATYDPPQVNQRRNERHVWNLPIIQINQAQAALWDVLRRKEDAWRDVAPLTNAYLMNPEGVIVKAYDEVDPRTTPKKMMNDLKSLQGAAAWIS